ncbi:MAG: S41 family peptidase [Lachnospiraceae bacterium]|nr:S41 family peptidase [Lachnospiraceae bacterium]MDE6976952.1 S41 family peptidase [Lachnospiraceae bacterium]
MDTFNRERNFRGFITGLSVGVLISALAVGGFCVARNFYLLLRMQSEQASADAQEEESVVNADTMQKMKTIEEVIANYYYGEETSSGELQDGIYKGMVKALGDPYSEYFTKDELEETLNSNQGISYGIGAAISLNKEMDTAMINSVIEDTPAEAAGLRAGDIIYKVDGEETFGMSLSQVVGRVKGKENTTVHLTIYREGEADLLEMDIVRGKLIEAETVQSGMLEETNQIGYLRITEFDTITVDQFNEAMAELNASGMKALILDLRSNPGGDLTAVVDVARRLLPEGLVVYTEDKAGKRKEYTCDGEHEIQIPVAVLVNEYSASASEILSGAIKDYNKGTLIGTTTYGKGIVQRINRLEDGTAVKLTVSAYFTPLGNNIHGIGIEPDIELEFDYEAYEKDGTDNQVEKAIEILEGKIS